MVVYLPNSYEETFKYSFNCLIHLVDVMLSSGVESAV